MSLPTDELNAVVETVTGREFSETQAKYIVRPDPELMSRLLKLHEGVGQLAQNVPHILEQPEVGRALEEQLIHLMVRCLAVDAPKTTASSRRHDAIMVRLEEFFEANPDQPLYLTEICAGIGVSERTLRGACEEHLGMGPIRFLTLRRVHLVRRSLLRADAKGTNVTRVATDHGFWELGRFSVMYRKLIGESPSETLRRPAEQPETNRDRPTALPIDLAQHLNRR